MADETVVALAPTSALLILVDGTPAAWPWQRERAGVFVHAIALDHPLACRISPGDEILAIDDEDVDGAASASSSLRAAPEAVQLRVRRSSTSAQHSSPPAIPQPALAATVTPRLLMGLVLTCAMMLATTVALTSRPLHVTELESLRYRASPLEAGDASRASAADERQPFTRSASQASKATAASGPPERGGRGARDNAVRAHAVLRATRARADRLQDSLLQTLAALDDGSDAHDDGSASDAIEATILPTLPSRFAGHVSRPDAGRDEAAAEPDRGRSVRRRSNNTAGSRRARTAAVVFPAGGGNQSCSPTPSYAWWWQPPDEDAPASRIVSHGRGAAFERDVRQLYGKWIVLVAFRATHGAQHPVHSVHSAPALTPRRRERRRWATRRCGCSTTT